MFPKPKWKSKRVSYNFTVMRKYLYLLAWVSGAAVLTWFNGGCAQIGMPTGGPKDSLAPVIVRTNPAPGATNFTGRTITFQFDEYIELQDLVNNLSYTPFQERSPVVSYNLKTVTIRLRDSLKPNTTYFISLGDAVKDLNEGNVYRDLSVAFSTGDVLDSLSLNGKVFLAETGGTDSTMVALLYRNAPDTAVKSRKPDYLSRIKGDGSFSFSYLPAGNYQVYALKDGDRDRTYNSKRETFAFLDSVVVLPGRETPITLYAYQEEKAPAPPKTGAASKILAYTTPITTEPQDILSPMTITFSKPLRRVTEDSISIIDSAGVKLEGLTFRLDTTNTILSVEAPWRQASAYRLVIPAVAVEDTSGSNLPKGDTISFQTRAETDYGTLLLRFQDLDLAQNPVLQIWNGDKLVSVHSLASPEWTSGMFIPGEYTIRLLYDRNGNGVWDPGSYDQKLQPELVVPVPQKITVRANWDNELDVKL